MLPAADRGVSRSAGSFRFHDGWWWLHNDSASCVLCVIGDRGFRVDLPPGLQVPLQQWHAKVTVTGTLGNYTLRLRLPDLDDVPDPGQKPPVSGEQLRVLMDVRRPDSGEALRRVGATGEAVAALDATFSVPKSVSAVWAVAERELRAEIEAAHETAIDRALIYAVRQVSMLRRKVSQDTVVHENAVGLVATSWRHTTARAVADQPPDPQLHSHVLLHAAVRRDGELVAIDSRSWLVHQREVGVFSDTLDGDAGGSKRHRAW